MSNQEYKYFYEDEVYRITKNGTLQFGMVVENAEFASSGDESDSDEDSPVKAGQVRVSWYPHGREEVVSDRRVHLADRSLMPGDIVRLIDIFIVHCFYYLTYFESLEASSFKFCDFK